MKQKSLISLLLSLTLVVCGGSTPEQDTQAQQNQEDTQAQQNQEDTQAQQNQEDTQAQQNQ
ncbi:MAG: hypothetical protein ACJ0GW_01230, partial [Candidatus Actinomarina sp.]